MKEGGMTIIKEIDMTIKEMAKRGMISMGWG